MKIKKIKISVVGAGNISCFNELDNFRKKPATHIGAYLKNKNISVEGIYDISKKKRDLASKKFKIKNFNSISDLINHTKPDILIVAVNYKNNLSVISKCLNLSFVPKVIFCEKPISNNYKSARKIYDLCKKKKVNLLVNNRRLEDKYAFLKRIINKQHVVHVNAKCSSGVHAIGIHMIDLLFFLFDECKVINSINLNENISRIKYSNNFEKNDPRYLSVLKIRNFYCFFFNTAKTDYSFFEIEIFTKKKKIIMSQNKNYISVSSIGKVNRSTLSYQLKKDTKYNINSKTLFENISKYLVKIVKQKKLNNNKLSGIHGLKSYEILDKLKRTSYN